MRRRAPLALLSGLLAAGVAAGQPPAGQPLPTPRVVPESQFVPARTPADDAAELHATRDFDTYVYVVNGSDVIHACGMKQLAARFRLSGYPHTKFGEWWDMAAFEAEYRRVRAENLNARVVLIGYDLGAYMVQSAAARLARDGFPVAMVGYVGGECLTDGPHAGPPGTQVVNVIGKGLVKRGLDLTGAANVRVPAMAWSLPGRPETFDALYMGLAGVSWGTDGRAPAAPATMTE